MGNSKNLLFYVLPSPLRDFVSKLCIGKEWHSFFAKINQGNKLEKFRSRSQGDHQATISFIQKLYNERIIRDPIQGNLIDDEIAYIWLLKQRERVNYQMKNFSDPYPDILFSHTFQYFEEKKLLNLFFFYKNDSNYITCFDKDHAILSLVFKKLIHVSKSIDRANTFSEELKRKFVASFTSIAKLQIERKELIGLILS